MSPGDLLDWHSPEYGETKKRFSGMKGLMMDAPLLVSAIAEHAAKFHGDREIVSVTADNPLHRYTIGEAVKRSRQVANALVKLGLQQGDRVATLA